mmetsp:Transcript_28423/g.43530  ORF Transcript_28423/g.43530 Transcript_28423/m.43530 type:complete len:97 (+) Transcript_28423:131-421(+)|eukprot:CAMPEP_0197737074 /NCGR_PEP_ID=MMETSP1435-20131217/6989_1 /TAXON_ID=426625 /ORGANISM="Chaetoceros brevis, Strain CCMP164" /LENGTH=96 /DNA_ID=CAMNT_0043325469 /DNA_START=13 /DNA_END=303 /DNA_ORIENTATION=+
MNAFQRIADVAHKSVVTGLFSYFAYTTFQVGTAVIGGSNQVEQEHPQAGFIQMLRDKASEEYKKYYKIDHREWYDKDDDSYLKQIPKPEEYQPKRK